MITFTRSKLGIEVKIDEAYNLGHKTGFVKLENRNEKNKIMQKRNKK